MSASSRNSNHHWEWIEWKKKTDSPGHNGLKLYNVLAQLRLATSKMKLNKVGIVLPYELPNDLI